MHISPEHVRILHEIQDGNEISEDDGNWAVLNGYAAHGEDGDIDLTKKGREALDGSDA